MYKLCFYVPASHLETVKGALFDAGAGRIGDYDSCSWQVLGEGQFRPLAGSQPYIGEAGQTETVAEYRVEMVCAIDCASAVVEALLDAHPYEEPAWHLVQIITDLSD